MKIEIDERKLRQWDEWPDLNRIVEECDPVNLVRHLLNQSWHYDCIIFPDYPMCDEIRGRIKGVYIWYQPKRMFLRYSRGPRQKTFWDIYGDDFVTTELAVIALADAPAPLESKLL